MIHFFKKIMIGLKIIFKLILHKTLKLTIIWSLEKKIYSSTKKIINKLL